MREIKFRGKRKDNGEWVYGYLVKAVNGKTYIITMWDNEGTYEDRPRILFIEVIPETVGQYTGMEDKNGTKIFEGDIITAWDLGVQASGDVRCRIDGFWYMYPSWQNEQFWYLKPNKDGVDDGVEVIGNIHDNPELL